MDTEDIFFIYDSKIMQNEYDIIEDAILFYHPKSIADTDTLYLLFGQLVGMAHFTENLTGALPKILRLEKTKYAVIKTSKYMMMLGCSTSKKNVPDAFLQNKLQRFLQILTFYHGSLARLYQQYDYQRSEFLLEIDFLCNSYLPFIEGRDSKLASIFNPLPSLSFTKASSMIYLKVNQILQECQRLDGVLSACLFSEACVVASQLPSEMLHNLMFLKANQKNLPAAVVYPGFEWPHSVKIIRVYLTPAQYEDIISKHSLSPYTTTGNSKPAHGNHIRKMKKSTEKSVVTKSKISSSNDSFFYDSIKSSKSFIDDSSSNNNGDHNGLYNLQTNASISAYSSKRLTRSDNSLLEGLIRQPASNRHINGELIRHEELPITETSHILKDSNVDEKEESSKRITDKESVIDQVSRELSFSAMDVYNQEYLQERKLLNKTVFNYDDEPLYHSIKFMDNVKEKDKVSSYKDLPKFPMTADISSPVQTTETETETEFQRREIELEEVDKKIDRAKPCDDMIELHLYIQAHSTSMLILLMTPQQDYHLQTFKTLWDLILPQLGDIEAQVKSLKSPNEKQNSTPKDAIRYLKYCKATNKCQGNVTEKTSSKDQLLLDTINVLHQQFSNATSLSDVTLRTNQTSIYGRHTDTDEIYLQPRGQYLPIPGAPSNLDTVWTIEERLSAQLKKNGKNYIVF